MKTIHCPLVILLTGRHESSPGESQNFTLYRCFTSALHCAGLYSTEHHTALPCTLEKSRVGGVSPYLEWLAAQLRPHYNPLHCTVLYCTTLHCTVLHSTALHCTALHCIVLQYTALYCTSQYCTASYYTAQNHTTMGQCTTIELCYTLLHITAIEN